MLKGKGGTVKRNKNAALGQFLAPPKLSSVHSLSCVRLFANSWTAARQASLSITNSRSLLKLMSIELVMPSNHIILCHPLLFLPSIFPNIRVFSNESVLHIRWPKYWSFSFIISPSNEYLGLISFRINWLDLLADTLLQTLIQKSMVFLVSHHTSSLCMALLICFQRHHLVELSAPSYMQYDLFLTNYICKSMVSK